MKFFGHIVDRNDIPQDATSKRVMLTTLCGKKRMCPVKRDHKKPLSVCARCVDSMIKYINEETIPKAQAYNIGPLETVEYYDEP